MRFGFISVYGLREWALPNNGNLQPHQPVSEAHE